MPIVYPAAQQFLGIAKETTPGTAADPQRFIPFRTFEPKDRAEILVDEGYRGSMAAEYGGVLGPRWAELELGGVPFSDTVGDLLLNMLGGHGVTGTGPYTHTFSLLNSDQGQPPTHTFTHRQGITATTGARAYPYVRISELSLTGNAEGLLEYEAKAACFPSEPAAQAPVNTPPTSSVTPAWRSSVSLGGTASPAVLEWSVQLTREQVIDHTADGTQTPFAIGDGEIKVSGKLTVRASDAAPLAGEAPLTTFLAGTVQPLVIAVASDYGGTAGHSLTITMSQCQFDAADLVQQTMFGYEIGFRAWANATDAGTSGGLAPIKAVLVNDVTTY